MLGLILDGQHKVFNVITESLATFAVKGEVG
jgi:hypothetical protein